MIDLWFGLLCAIGGIIAGYYYGHKKTNNRLDELEHRLMNGENKLLEVEILSKLNIKCPMCGYDFPITNERDG